MGVKISNLPAIVTPSLTDVFPVVQAGVTYKETFTQLSSLLATVGVTTITGTANQVIASAAVGPVTLSLPQSIATTSDVTFGSVTFSPTTKGIVGTTTNNNAAATYVGEYIESEILVGAAVSVTTATATDITSISLTAGDWDVWGNVQSLPDAATTTTLMISYVSATSATIPVYPNKGAVAEISGVNIAAGQVLTLPTGTRRYSVAAPTTIYLEVYMNFAVNTMTAFGCIAARRVR